MKTLTDVVDYWFEKPNDYQKWFFSGTKIDQYLKTNYEDLLRQQLELPNTQLETKIDSSQLKNLLGKIILLDQFTRHIYRGTPKAFSGDPTALKLTLLLLETGKINQLTAIEKTFALMPLQHSEKIEDKQLILDYLVTLYPTPEEDKVFQSLKQHTINHRNVLVQFSRYPKRNQVLGRTSTAEELQYIRDNPNSHY